MSPQTDKTHRCDVLTRIYEKSTRTGDSKTQQNSNNCTAVASHFNKTAANDLFRGWPIHTSAVLCSVVAISQLSSMQLPYTSFLSCMDGSLQKNVIAQANRSKCPFELQQETCVTHWIISRISWSSINCMQIWGIIQIFWLSSCLGILINQRAERCRRCGRADDKFRRWASHSAGSVPHKVHVGHFFLSKCSFLANPVDFHLNATFTHFFMYSTYV